LSGGKLERFVNRTGVEKFQHHVLRQIVEQAHLNISFYGDWDNRPPLAFSGSDYGTSSGVQLEVWESMRTSSREGDANHLIRDLF
jgi:hypothetical protein